MTTERIDVLAVMDRLLECVSVGVDADDPVRQLIEAGHEGRAAVAELIEAAIELRQRQRDYLADPRDQRSNEKGRLVGVAAERVDAALARVGAP